MSYPYVLPMAGGLMVALGIVEGGWMWLAVWLGLDFVVLGAAYGRGAHGVFGKRSDGTVPGWAWFFFLPFFAYRSALWHVLRLVNREPACNEVNPNLTIGRRLLGGELRGQFENYVDLTAEFAAPRAIRSLEAYRCFPILDAAAPSPDALREVIQGLRPGRTFVHCAQGHGRTGLFALALLLSSGAARDVESGLRLLTSARPRVRLNAAQRRCIQRYAETCAQSRRMTSDAES